MYNEILTGRTPFLSPDQQCRSIGGTLGVPQQNSPSSSDSHPIYAIQSWDVRRFAEADAIIPSQRRYILRWSSNRLTSHQGAVSGRRPPLNWSSLCRGL